jgi:bifunctional UDP-N-acetylglucosamine pyrophosphorylase/glucosamine-1-phosphate N-acetyltransferase
MQNGNNTTKIRIIILAAGKGTRMKSELPKVLAPLRGQHMIRHLLESVEKSGIDPRPIVVVGHEKELVMKELGSKYEYVVQEELLGTGHAVACAQVACAEAENVIVISGDQPFIKTETIKNLLNKHLSSAAKLTITTALLPDFQDWREAFIKYGRIIRDGAKIIDREYKDANEEEKKITEVNVSLYAFNTKWLWENYKKINSHNNAQKEYYLTDLWQIASQNGDKMESVQIDPAEALGANSKEELEILENFT